MALTILTGSSQAAAFNYSYTTSGSADWASVPTASYFYDIVDKTVRFKATNSTFSNVATASLALTASSVIGTVTSASYAITASYILNAVSSSFSTTSSYALSASYVQTSQTASYVLNAVSSSFATTASYVLNAVSSSFATTASYVQTAQTASYVQTAQTASYITASNVVGTVTSASYTVTASYSATSDYATNSYGAIISSDATGIASAITNNTDNNILTATGTGQINGESTLTYDGTTLTAGGAFIQGEGGSATGAYSHVEGSKNNSATGDYSHAEGYTTNSAGQYSHAEGYNNQAIGDYSHAEGSGTETNSNGFASHAEGQGTITFGTASHAEGDSTQTIGSYSHAEGSNTVTVGNVSHTEGNLTQTGFEEGYLSTAVGAGTCSLDASYGDVSAEYTAGDIILFDDTPFDDIYGVQTFIVSTIFWNGTNTEVRLTDTSVTTTTAIIGNITTGVENWAGGYSIGGTYSHAEGIGTITLGNGQHVSGKYNTIGDATSLFIVGNGTADNSRSDAFKVTPSGSIILPTIQSNTPSWTGTPGEMVFGDDGAGTYTMYVWLNGAWRTSSLS